VGFQEGEEFFRLERAARGQGEAGAAEGVAGGNALDQGVDRGEHDARGGGGLQQAG
jgi:hypothetical protein